MRQMRRSWEKLRRDLSKNADDMPHPIRLYFARRVASCISLQSEDISDRKIETLFGASKASVTRPPEDLTTRTRIPSPIIISSPTFLLKINIVSSPYNIAIQQIHPDPTANQSPQTPCLAMRSTWSCLNYPSKLA